MNYEEMSIKIAILEYKIKSLDEKITQLESKRFSNIFAKNWTNIPTLVIIFGGILYGANWIYDLPSPSQQVQITKLANHLDQHTNKSS